MTLGFDIGSFVFRLAALSNNELETTTVYRKYSAFLNHEIAMELPVELVSKLDYPFDQSINNLKKVFSSPESSWSLLDGLIEGLIKEEKISEELHKTNLVLAMPGSQCNVGFSKLITLRSLIAQKFNPRGIRYIPETVALLAYFLSKSEKLISTKADFLILDFGAELLEAHVLSYENGSKRIIREIAILDSKDSDIDLLSSFGFYRELFGKIEFGSFLKLWHHMHATGSEHSGAFSSEWKRILQFNNKMPIITFEQIAGIRVHHDSLVKLYERSKSQLRSYLRTVAKEIKKLDLDMATTNIVVGGGFCQNMMIRTLIKEAVVQEFSPGGTRISFEGDTDAVAIGASLIGIGSYEYYTYPATDIQFHLRLFKRKFLVENGETSLEYKPYDHRFCSVYKDKGIVPFKVHQAKLKPEGGYIGSNLRLTVNILNNAQTQSIHYLPANNRTMNKVINNCHMYYYFDLQSDIHFFLEIDNQIMFLEEA